MNQTEAFRRDTSMRLPLPLLSVKDVATRISVSTKTVRRLITDKQIKAHRVRRSLRISEEDLKAYLDGSQ